MCFEHKVKNPNPLSKKKLLLGLLNDNFKQTFWKIFRRDFVRSSVVVYHLSIQDVTEKR